MNATTDNFLWETRKRLWHICGSMDAGNNALYPILWYIETGRASAEFIRKLISAKPFVIARVLAKPGSVDDTVNAICKKIRYEREAH